MFFFSELDVFSVFDELDVFSGNRIFVKTSTHWISLKPLDFTVFTCFHWFWHWSDIPFAVLAPLLPVWVPPWPTTHHTGAMHAQPAGHRRCQRCSPGFFRLGAKSHVIELIRGPWNRTCQNLTFWENVHAGIWKKSVEAPSVKTTVLAVFC